MKLAIVHDWLQALGGAERVLIELHEMFPDAPIYTLFENKDFTQRYLPNATIRTSFLQRIPNINRWYRFTVPLMPTAIESFDLGQYDVVLSSSISFSKGLILKPKTRHICYCYSPTRFLWDRHAVYESRGWSSGIVRHFLRLWDHSAADRVDEFIAISQHVQKRIQKYYRRSSEVIYPPVHMLDPGTATVRSDLNNFYLIVSRLHPHKNVDIAVEAFNKLKFPLVIIGTGPDEKRLRRMAHSNITFLGHQPDEVVAAYYRAARAFIMPQEEDFGITPIEAMMHGTPVLALGRGGATETIRAGVTGEFFEDPIPEALADGVRRLNDAYATYNTQRIKDHANEFSHKRFQNEIFNLLAKERILQS